MLHTLPAGYHTHHVLNQKSTYYQSDDGAHRAAFIHVIHGPIHHSP